MKSSMQSNIIWFFFFSTLIAMVVSLSFIAYQYKKGLEVNIKGALSLILSDIKREHLGVEIEMQEMLIFAEEIESSSYAKLLDDLKLERSDMVPSQEDRIYVSVQLEGKEKLILSCSDKLLYQRVIEFIMETFFLFSMVFIVLASFFVWYIRYQFRALHCLVDFCASAKEDKTPECNGTYEVKNLRDAIVSLIKTNDNLCEQKQELFKEAAHELKSPIAVLKARLSLFEKDGDINKQEFIHESKEDIARITSKLKELIFLKSIEWDMQLALEDVNMEDNCKLMQDAFAPILKKKHVTVDSQWEEGFVIKTYKSAMQKVLQAVFENIFIHTKENSTIRVRAKPKKIHIVNEIGTKDDIPLFSSYIGMKMIARLSEKLAYEYKTYEDGKFFHTELSFRSLDENVCEL